MSDFELLKSLHEELIKTLNKRIEYNKSENKNWTYPKHICKAKIRRLRLEIQDVMFRIEHNLNMYISNKDNKEKWYK